MTDDKIEVKIIVYGWEGEDVLERRMVQRRIEDLEAEFERNGIPTRVIKT